MTPVDQTITGDNGDCFRAAIASIIDLPVAEVPHFLEKYGSEMHRAAMGWLAKRGVVMLPMYFQNPEALQQTHFAFSGYCIWTGYSPRKNDRGDHRQHAVVAKTLPWGVQQVHDPHPDKSGLLNWGHQWVYLFVFPPKKVSPRKRRKEGVKEKLCRNKRK